MTILLRLFLLLLTLIASPVLAHAQDDAEKSSFIQWVEDKISTPDRRITLGQIDGALSSDVRFDKITVSDTTGVYLTISDVHLIWSRTALFTGSLSIDLLEARSIRYDRPAVITEAPVTPAARDSFSVPELPVNLTITELSVPEVTLGAPVLGEAVQMSVNGSLALVDGTLASNLDIIRTDAKPGEFRVKANYDNASGQLDLDLGVNEPAGGVIATLLSIPDRPALGFRIAGTGPVTNFSAGIGLSANGAELLTGSTTITRADNGDYRFKTDVSGLLESLISPVWKDYVQGAPSLSIDGIYATDGSLILNAATLTSGGLKIYADGKLGPDGFPTGLNASASLTPTGQKIPFPGLGMIDGGRINLSFGGDRASWVLDGGLIGVDTGTIQAQELRLVFGGDATDLADPAKRAITIKGGARFEGILASTPELAAALGQAFYLRLDGGWSAGKPLNISNIAVENSIFSTSYAGAVDGTTLNGRFALVSANVAPLSGLAGRPVSGAVDMAATGMVDLFTGGFNLALDGKTTDLGLGDSLADRLLAGPTRLEGRLRRDQQGLHAEKLALANLALQAQVDGAFNTDSADLTLEARLSDLGLVSDKANGAVRVTGTIKGSGESRAVIAEVTAPSLKVNRRSLTDLRLGFVGMLAGSDLDGNIAGEAAVDGLAARLSALLASEPDGSRKLTDLTLDAGKTRAEGNLTVLADGLLEGSLAFASSDLGPVASLALLDVSGAANGSLVLSPQGSQQTAFVKATVKGLKSAGVGVGSGSVDLAINDLFGQLAADGRLELAGLTASGVSVGKVSATLTPANGETGIALVASGIGVEALSGYPVGTLALDLKGRSNGSRLAISSARVVSGSGLQLSVNGTLPFSGGGLGLDVTGALPLALVNPALAERGTRLAGTAAIDVTIAGALASPVITGRVTTDGASLVDPDTTTRITGISARVSFDSSRARIETLTGTVNSSGLLTIRGDIGLAGDLPANLTIGLTTTRLTDGKIATAQVSGDLTVRGSLLSGPIIGGIINVARAEITVPESLPAGTPLIDVEHRLPPPNVQRTLQKLAAISSGSASGGGSAWLDLTISAPSKIFVRGRGIDAELGGNLKITGPISAVQPVGGFELIRGRVDVIGQRLTLTRGSVTLSGDLDPYIDFAATTSANGITVTAAVVGFASAPAIELSSSPSLPEDEILAYLLFGRSLSDLSPLQIAKLALAAAQLGGGSGSDLVGKLRGATGLDDLDVVTDDNGNAAVKAGRYVTDNVYLGVTAGQNGQSNVSVNLDLTDNLKARAEVGPSSGSKLGIFYEKEY